MSTGGRHLRSAAVLTGGVATVAAVVTLAVVALPSVRFGYRAPELHVALETANGLVALLVGFLVYGRFRQNRRTQELLLLLALCTVAVANLVLTTVPVSVTVGRGEDFTRWASLGIRLLGTLLLTAAALVRPAATVDVRSARRIVSVTAVAVGVVAVAGAVWGSGLPPTVTVAEGTPQMLVAHPAVTVFQAAGAVLYGVAAVAFTRQAGRSADELFRWVAAGCVLAGFSYLHYLLFPSLYSEYVYSGDLLRLGFYLVLLAGAAREIRSYWALRTRTAVLEDRRRMARDLHDGLAQELAYIWSQSQTLTGRPTDGAVVERIAGAAGRALDEARRAIAALSRPLNEPFVDILQRLADDLADRYDVKVHTALDPTVDVTPQDGEALVRIVTEAVRNAVRHGRASEIDLALSDEPRSLTITDDGRGFSTGPLAEGRGGGFGLTSMRERARALGAEFTVISSPGAGATVRLTWA